MAAARRSTDVSRLSFPLQIVVGIVASILSAASVVWVNQSGIKESQAQIQSDLRNLITKMEEREKVVAAEAKTRDVSINSDYTQQKNRIEALDAKIEEVKRNYQLADFNLRSEIKDAITAAIERKR
jgi:hypothetical protein